MKKCWSYNDKIKDMPMWYTVIFETVDDKVSEYRHFIKNSVFQRNAFDVEKFDENNYPYDTFLSHSKVKDDKELSLIFIPRAIMKFAYLSVLL